MSAFADPHVVGTIHAAFGQAIDLVQHCRWIDDHTGRDEILNMLVQNPAGDVVQFVSFIASDHGVSRVRTALVADDHVELGGQQVDELSFCFVSPLQTDYASSRHQPTPNVQAIKIATDGSPRKRKRLGAGLGTGNLWKGLGSRLANRPSLLFVRESRTRILFPQSGQFYTL